ncbi:hydrogenase maturation nickel metallochaperone HypA [Aliiruegeria lutimaris]|uniref:Hydrogenase maturation factor HypA n=1 Tax=Aliiruegeria lutimaris TaxID=571298 RepID=A0A1G8YXJ8_9RHOB|nr:hydrogenase maturation nickel metallochaperone HypA [Aliiruegeria lutimaris]SDK07521.1 hydrogenase nickel incorporation protein HypA/HybF [Aliiruegeria lutimaris]
MHELSICRALIEQVREIARNNDASRVTEISLEVGPLSGVMPELLLEAFPMASAGSMAEGARLIVDMEPVRVWCSRCQLESAATLNRLVCAQCGDWRTELRSGDALMLKSVVLEEARSEPSGQPAEEQGYV